MGCCLGRLFDRFVRQERWKQKHLDLVRESCSLLLLRRLVKYSDRRDFLVIVVGLEYRIGGMIAFAGRVSRLPLCRLPCWLLHRALWEMVDTR